MERHSGTTDGCDQMITLHSWSDHAYNISFLASSEDTAARRRFPATKTRLVVSFPEQIAIRLSEQLSE